MMIGLAISPCNTALLAGGGVSLNFLLIAYAAGAL